MGLFADECCVAEGAMSCGAGFFRRKTVCALLLRFQLQVRLQFTLKVSVPFADLPPSHLDSSRSPPHNLVPMASWKTLDHRIEVMVGVRPLLGQDRSYYVEARAEVPMPKIVLDAISIIAQDGDFYGRWITTNLRGPFKGAAGTLDGEETMQGGHFQSQGERPFIKKLLLIDLSS
jgi:hypothetical protein